MQFFFYATSPCEDVLCLDVTKENSISTEIFNVYEVQAILRLNEDIKHCSAENVAVTSHFTLSQLNM